MFHQLSNVRLVHILDIFYDVSTKITATIHLKRTNV